MIHILFVVSLIALIKVLCDNHKLRRRIEQRDLAFDQFESYCFEKAIFLDSEGRFQHPYNTDEVLAKWDMYQKLNRTYRCIK